MEIKEIRYKVNSSSATTPPTRLHDNKPLYIYADDSFWQIIQIHIMGSTKEDDFDDFENIDLGFLEGTYFKIEDMEMEGINKFDLFDNISQEIHDLYSNLFDMDGIYKDGVIGIKGNVFSIDRLYIENEYRNCGIGRRVIVDLQNILDYSLNCKIGNFILLPSAIEKVEEDLRPVSDEKEYAALTKRLQAFYRRLGFKKVPKGKHMWFNTDYRMKGTEE